MRSRGPGDDAASSEHAIDQPVLVQSVDSDVNLGSIMSDERVGFRNAPISISPRCHS
jgi:hypothetical protein